MKLKRRLLTRLPHLSPLLYATTRRPPPSSCRSSSRQIFNSRTPLQLFARASLQKVQKWFTRLYVLWMYTRGYFVYVFLSVRV